MKKIFCIWLLITSHSPAFCQDKDAVARVHYTNAEEAFNKGTKLGAENCIEELEEAERTLGTTNSKILYLKIKALDKFYDSYYHFDKVISLKKFFKITDAKTFPADKYADIIKINSMDYLVQDTAFETKIRTDSSFIKEFFKWSPLHKYTAEAYYRHGEVFRSESYQASHGNNVDVWSDPGYKKAISYFYLAAEKGHKESMSELSSMYHYGQGALKDELKALEWAIKANDTSQITFLYNIAPEKTISDGQKVIDWCSSVANSKTSLSEEDLRISKYALETIGMVYEKGLGGIQISNCSALEWYIKAYEKDKRSTIRISRIETQIYKEKDKEVRKKMTKLFNDWVKAQNKK